MITHTSEVAFVQLVESAAKMEAAGFLHDLILAGPYRIHTVPTDHGTRCTLRKQDIRDVRHIFDRGCDAPCSGCAAAPSGDRTAMASRTA